MDTVALDGPTNLVAGRGRLESVERIDVENGQFDTVVVLGDLLKTADEGEVDVRADWFDIVIVDPRLQWERTPSESFADELLKTRIDGTHLQVRVPIGTYVLTGKDIPALVATSGPAGDFVWGPSMVASSQPETLNPEPQEVTLRWAEAGIARPDLSAFQTGVRRVNLDLQNDAANIVEISTDQLYSRDIDEIHLKTDAIDRVFVSDPQCWTRQGHTDPDLARLSSEHDSGRSAEIHLSRFHLSRNSYGRNRHGRAENPGVWHLSRDAQKALDAIDLRNGGKDFLILRNDGRLRRATTALIFGDPGDEVWLDGTAGWSIGFDDLGLTARLPADFRNAALVVGVNPGVVLRQMPMPAFLGNPALLDLSHYPGSRNESDLSKTLYVTRGGYVGFSAEQFANRQLIDLTNGAQNILRLHPDDLSKAASSVEIRGDSDLDILFAREMPAPEIQADGTYVWRLTRNGATQTITSKPLNIIR